jgi:hypothetical protein
LVFLGGGHFYSFMGSLFSVSIGFAKVGSQEWFRAFEVSGIVVFDWPV